MEKVYEEIIKMGLRLFVQFKLITGGKIVTRLDGRYLVWSDSGFMAMPPRQYEIKISD